MLITNTQSLLEAIDSGKKLTLDANHTLKTQGFFSRVAEWFSDIFKSTDAINARAQEVQLAMAQLIKSESSSEGPQSLQDKISLDGQSVEETAQKAKMILGESIIQHAVKQELKDEPGPVQQGVILYLQAKWAREHAQDPIDFTQLKEATKEEIQTLKERPANLLGHLACGYTLHSEDLTNQMKHLEQGFKDGVMFTWDDQHKHQFDNGGLYAVFTKDASRDRPSIQGQRFSLEDYDNDEAANLYNELLKKEFSEKSMAAVVGICMSQTSLPNLAQMVMCLGTEYTLNPYILGSSMEMSEIMPTVSNNATDKPRMTLTHNDTEITLQLIVGITLSDTTVAPVLKQEVGTVSAKIVIPKDQFPLPLGTEPKLTVTEMKLERPYGFTGEEANE